MSNFAEILSDARRLVAARASQELVLSFLRERGLNKIDSTRAIGNLYEIGDTQAKDLVDRSQTWSDRYERDPEFREMAIRALRDLAADLANDPNQVAIKFENPLERPDPPE
jgi:hypothetical protein